MMRRVCLMIVLLLAAAGMAAAQTSAPLWVRLFEDANANSVLDAGENVLSEGGVVTLLNEAGVVVASALLDNAPNADRGLVGFQNLPPGTYTVQVSAAGFSPTGSAQFTQVISADADPVLIEFGARGAVPEGMEVRRGLFGTRLYIGTPDQVARVGYALLGALAVVGIMTLLGFVVYVGIVRRRLRRQFQRAAAPQA
ncbi:MAG: hypothetical protein KME04_08710 [Pleurocapsa minor GSE-CHR-MK-17-07R]|jgi:type II secretory pathway pseudopilin PulG|nr:hypothetical protein [Pleurocapsa minor GSE-CHR-MK 17-07R]